MERLKSVWGALMQVLDRMDRLNIGLIAAGIGFFAMLATFPALAAMVMILSVLADPNDIGALLEVTDEVLPPEVHKIISDQVQGLISAGRYDSIGWASALSFGVALWSARAGVAALVTGLNAVYRTDHRPPLRRFLVSVWLTLTLCALTLVAIGAVVITPIVLAIVPLGPSATLVVESVRWLVAFGVIVIALGILYRFAPNRRGRRPRWLNPGSLMAAVLWLAGSFAFSIYLSNFGNYNEIYGSIGAAVALLMWYYLSAYAVLLGGTLNVELETLRAARTPPADGRSGDPPPEPPEGNRPAG